MFVKVFKTLKLTGLFSSSFLYQTMFPITKIRVKRTFMEKFLRKAEFVAKQRVRDKQLRLDRRLKDIFTYTD
jgi:hypothetical protein